MNREDVRVFLGMLGVHRSTDGKDWVNAPCPLASWTHRSGKDAHPSFGIFVNPTGISGAKCLTGGCDFTGSLLELVHTIRRYSGRDLPEVQRFVETHNGPQLSSVISTYARKHRPAAVQTEPRPDPQSVPEPLREIAGIVGVQLYLTENLKDQDRKLPVLPETVLTKLPPPKDDVLRYLLGEKRNLTPLMIQTFDLRWDPQLARIIIPVRDCLGRLVGLSGRAFYESTSPKYKHSEGFKKSFYLYGESFWDYPKFAALQTCCVVEGFFDVMRLMSYGYPAAAVMGSSISEFQIEKLVRRFSRIIIVPDGDDPGRDAAKKWRSVLSMRLPTHVVSVQDKKDPDDLTPAQAVALLGPPD